MMGLTNIKKALTSTGAKVYMFNAPPKENPPYIVYAPDGANDFMTEDRHGEKAIEGTIDLYTKNSEDPLKEKIENALDDLAGQITATWSLNSIQQETEAGSPQSGYTGLIHFEWVFQVT